jgi:hypothetical protein
MAELQPNDLLFIPKRRRFTRALLADAEGREELHIFYGEKEIIFDEPDLLSFGQKLLDVDRFKAEEAVTWSDAAPYAWERVRELLETLMAEQIVERYDHAAAAAPPRTFPATLGRAKPGQQPETYSAHEAGRCPMTTQKMLGRAVDLGNLEVVLPVQRVAHPAVDMDGRQVGENNVVDPLFLDLPTERRLCNYAGSRFHNQAPMNYTALRGMTKRWPELLSLTEQFRDAFFARMPRIGPAMLAGEVHLLAVTSLASLGYVMVRGIDPVPNGQLDAGLAAMFRLIDGVRICTTQMVRDTAGDHSCERVVSAKIIHDYAEQNQLFNDTWGVCAGPGVLIDEYLGVLVDGNPAPIKAEPSLAARLGDLAAALDYGLHGLRVEAMVRACGAMQGQLHERLRLAFEKHATARSRLQGLLEIPVDREHYQFLRTDHPLPETYEMEIRVARWLLARARTGLSAELPGTLGRIDDLRGIEPGVRAAQNDQLTRFLATAAPAFDALPEPLRADLAATMTEFFALQRRCLRAVGAEQEHLNQRLQRPQGRPLCDEDLNAYARRASPALNRVFAEGLGVAVKTDASATVLGQGDSSLSLTD